MLSWQDELAQTARRAYWKGFLTAGLAAAGIALVFIMGRGGLSP